MTGLRADAVLFDKDGTLFDFNATWVAWVEAMLARWSAGDAGLADRLAMALDFDRAARVFRPGSVVIAGTPDDVAAAVAPVLGAAPGDLVARLNAEAAAAPMAEAVPLAPLLSGLAGAGLRLGVATNDGEAPARAHLARSGVEGLFAFIAGSDSGHGGKPAPGMLLAFAAAVGIDPERIVMVGDSTHDLRAGRAAGMQTIGVLTGLAAAETLAPFADAVLPDIGHLPDWLADVE
ncbi:MAG: HAD family hydrolase [Maritimibacter sp.]|nr:HAD family hydrolase [Maritimibacter sp.]